MESKSGSNNSKDYRFVSLHGHSPSFMMNNLTTNGGENFVYVNTGDGGPKAVIYSKEIIEKTANTDIPQPQIFQWKDQSDCFAIKYVQVQEKWYLVICTTKGCQIYNHNGTRQLVTVESKKKLNDGKINFFTCVSQGVEKGSGEEFIAAGTSTGEIHSVMINGSSFAKDLGF